MRDELVIARPVYRTIAEECLAHPDVETGGVLVGRRFSHFLVAAFNIPAGGASRRVASAFAPDPDWQQQYLNYLVDRFDINYIGDWHKHPGSFDQPSDRDFRTAREIVTESAWDVAEAVFPIAVIRSSSIALRAYLMRRGATAFVEMPITILNDTDYRIRQILLQDRGPQGRQHERQAQDAAHRSAAGASRRGFVRRVIERVRSRPSR